MVGRPMAIDLANDYEVTIADISKENLDLIPDQPRITKLQMDLSVPEKVSELVRNYDMAVNATPGFMGFQTLEAVINAGRNVIDIAFFPEDPMKLDELARQRGVVAIMDCGVAPGMSNILTAYAASLLDEATLARIYVGGLPVIREKPFEYKAVFSPIDVIEEYTRTARFVENGQLVCREALSEPELMNFQGIGTLEAFNSDGLRSLIDTVKCPDMKEKTLRYPGHIEKMKFLRDVGFFSQEAIEIKGTAIRPIDLTAKLMFPKWKLGDGEQDLTVMEVYVEGYKAGKKQRISYYLLDYYDPQTKVHSMARTTGYTATVAVRMVASGLYKDKGVSVPEYISKYPECVEFMLKGLAERKVVYRKTVEEIS